MGQAESQPTPLDLPPSDAEDTEAPLVIVAPPATLPTLPPDVLLLVAVHLSLSGLSSLGAVNAELHARLYAAEFDALFAPLLGKSIDYCSIIQPKTSDEVNFMDSLTRLRAVAETNQCGFRRACARLREMLCSLCNRKQACGLYFELTARGICSTCINYHPGHTERFRQKQAVRERNARHRRDERDGAALFEAVRHALPSSVQLAGRSYSTKAMPAGHHRPKDGEQEWAGDVESCPRLVLLFDSSRHGGSANMLFRAAEAAPGNYTLLVAHRALQGDAADDHHKRAETKQRMATNAQLAEETTTEETKAEETMTDEIAVAPACRTFGAFLDKPWAERSTTGYFGGEHAFLFRIIANGSTSSHVDYSMAATTASSAGASSTPRADVRTWSGHDRRCVHASTEFGIGFGGEMGRFGLSFDPDLTRGSCHPMLTYADSTTELLAPPTFLCESVQLWALSNPCDFADGGDGTRRRRRPAPWEDQHSAEASALEPGENKIVLEFLGMDKEASRMQDWARR